MYIFTYTLCCISSFIVAQKMDAYLISNGSSAYKDTQISVELSLGEVSVAHHTSDNIQITEGFYQGSFLGTSTHEVKVDYIKVRPNPFSDFVSFTGYYDSGYNISIYDYLGKKLWSKIDNIGDYSVNLHFLHQGVYLCKIQFQNNESQSIILTKL